MPYNNHAKRDFEHSSDNYNATDMMRQAKSKPLLLRHGHEHKYSPMYAQEWYVHRSLWYAKLLRHRMLAVKRMNVVEKEKDDIHSTKGCFFWIPLVSAKPSDPFAACTCSADRTR